MTYKIRIQATREIIELKSALQVKRYITDNGYVLEPNAILFGIDRVIKDAGECNFYLIGSDTDWIDGTITKE